MRNKKVWLVQDNAIENTDIIFVFSSKKKALEWIERDTGEEYENQDEYNLECRTLL